MKKSSSIQTCKLVEETVKNGQKMQTVHSRRTIAWTTRGGYYNVAFEWGNGGGAGDY